MIVTAQTTRGDTEQRHIGLVADCGRWGAMPTATPIVIREAARAGGYMPVHNDWYDTPRQPDPNP